jgi:hypothetical protein
MDWKKFILWEAASRDTIDVKRCYIDVVKDLIAGILLSQIIYRFLPEKNGRPSVSRHSRTPVKNQRRLSRPL